MRSHQIHNLSKPSWQTPGAMKSDVCSSVRVLHTDHESMMCLNRTLRIHRCLGHMCCAVPMTHVSSHQKVTLIVLDTECNARSAISEFTLQQSPVVLP